MAIKIVNSGKEPEIREALGYLERAYGIPPEKTSESPARVRLGICHD